MGNIPEKTHSWQLMGSYSFFFPPYEFEKQKKSTSWTAVILISQCVEKLVWVVKVVNVMNSAQKARMLVVLMSLVAVVLRTS